MPSASDYVHLERKLRALEQLYNESQLRIDQLLRYERRAFQLARFAAAAAPFIKDEYVERLASFDNDSDYVQSARHLLDELRVAVAPQ